MSDTIILNTDAGYAEPAGSWNQWVQGFVGAGRYAGASNSVATWQFTGLTTSVAYKISYYYPPRGDNSTSVPYQILDSDGTTVLASGTMDQTSIPAPYVHGGVATLTWTRLSNSVIPSGTSLTLKITNTGASGGNVFADAAVICPASDVNIVSRPFSINNVFQGSTYQLEGPPLHGFQQDTYGPNLPNTSLRCKASTATIGLILYAFFTGDSYFRLWKLISGKYRVVGDIVTVPLVPGYQIVNNIWTGLDDSGDQEYILEVVVGTASGVGLFSMITSTSTGVNSAHGYSTYRDAYVLFSDSLGIAADANTGTGEPAGVNYWIGQVCERNGVACVNYGTGGARTAADDGTASGGVASLVASGMSALPVGMAVTRVYTTSGRNNIFGSWTTTQTYNGYVTLMNEIIANVSGTCEIDVIYMFYTGNSTLNGTDDSHIVQEMAAVATFLPDSRIVEWDARSAFGLIQPDNYSGTAFTAHLAQSGNDKVADGLAPVIPSAPTVTMSINAAGNLNTLTFSEAVPG